MRTPRTILAGLATLALGLAAVPAAAGAGVTYGQVASFGGGKIEHPVGVAVDQATGDVYASSLVSNDRLDKFTATGTLLPPSPFGAGEPLLGSTEELFSGVAVDPVNGHLYAVDAVGRAIQTYDGSTGALLSHFSVEGSQNFGNVYTVEQIASDSAGEVYLANAPNNEVQEFNPAGTVLRTFTGSGASALKEPTGVAVSPSSGDVYVADSANNRIEEFSPAGALLGSIASPGVQALALDAAGEILAGDLNSEDSCGSLPSPCFHVVLYSPAGAELGDFGAGAIGTSEFGVINTLATGPNGWVYIADGGNNLVRAYARQSEPSLLSVSSTAVTQTTAALHATIDPHNADTTYHFEYGTSTTYGTSYPVPDADIGNGVEGPVLTGQALSGLQPDTTYHYRIVASNALGRTTGADQTFTTLPQSPLTVSTGQAGGVAQNTATLTGTIETQGYETTYEFDLGTDTSYGTRIFGDAGSEPGPQTFKAELQGLAPGTTYHYRIVATSALGTIYGADQTFTTTTYPTSTLTTPASPPLVPAPLLAFANTGSKTGAHTANTQPTGRTARDHNTPKNNSKPRRHRHKGNSSSGVKHPHRANTKRGKQ
jgi:DNA-binding beta-propeller fold protein YncE